MAEKIAYGIAELVDLSPQEPEVQERNGTIVVHFTLGDWPYVHCFDTRNRVVEAAVNGDLQKLSVVINSPAYVEVRDKNGMEHLVFHDVLAGKDPWTVLSATTTGTNGLVNGNPFWRFDSEVETEDGKAGTLVLALTSENRRLFIKEGERRVELAGPVPKKGKPKQKSNRKKAEAMVALPA